MKRKYMIIIITLLIGIVLTVCVCIYKRDRGFQRVIFTESIYEYHDEKMSVKLRYPQLAGSSDTEKEKRINQLIKDDVLKVMEQEITNEYGYRFDIGVRKYEIKFADEKIISIVYYGWKGWLAGARGLPATMFATTIDIENEKVLELQDVIVDMDGLYKQLINDCFEHITAWEGETGGYRISTDFYDAESLKKALLDGGVEWYVNGKDFVLADLEYKGGGVGYNEYAREISQLKGIIKDEFLYCNDAKPMSDKRVFGLSSGADEPEGEKQSETGDLSQEEEAISEAEDSLMDMEGYLHVDADEDGLDWGVYDRLTCSCFPYEYEEIPYADENTFQAVKDAYEEIDYLGECMPVSEADREKALEKFVRLMRNEMPFVDADTGEKRYVKDLQYYERYYYDKWRYYLRDMTGDGILEACIKDSSRLFLDGIEYIFEYHSETDEYFLLKNWYIKGNVTVQGIHIGNGGRIFDPGYDSIMQEFTRTNPDGDPILKSFFFAARDTMLTSEHREYIYMAMIPWYADPEKKVPVTEEMKQQGIYEKKSGQWYFRITEEQFEELEKSYEEAWKTAENKMEEEWMTYEELLSAGA